MSKTQQRGQPHATTAPPASKYRLPLIIVVLLLLGAALLVRQHFGANSTAVDLFIKGVNLRQAGRADEAVDAWTQAIQDDPDLADAYIALSDYYIQTGDLDKAMTVVGELRERQPNNPEMLVSLADIVTKRQDKDAIVAAKAAVAAAPNSARAHVVLGAAYAQEYDNVNAIKEIMAGERLDPTNVDYYVLGAEYLMSANNYAQVEAQSRKCIELMPGNAEAWYMLGWSLANRPTPDNLSKAETALQQSVQLNPKSFDAWLELGDAAFQLGQKSDAMADLERARTLGQQTSADTQNTQQRLQDRIRVGHLLLEIYQATGNVAKANAMRQESEQLGIQVQAVIHQSGHSH